jgi:hypothetical protein
MNEINVSVIDEEDDLDIDLIKKELCAALPRATLHFENDPDFDGAERDVEMILMIMKYEPDYDAEDNPDANSVSIEFHDHLTGRVFEIAVSESHRRNMKSIEEMTLEVIAAFKNTEGVKYA